MFVEALSRLRRGLVFALFWLIATVTALAGGPRWVTGPPYFSTSGVPVAWYTNHPRYFTDSGDLSAYVDHAAADAIVNAAAAVWNVPTSSLTLSYGGSLDEDVSSANVYLGSNGLILPSDVQSSNYQSKQIAVIYDRDGSVTDLLLGNGASDPSGCRQNAVTESVDSIVAAGYIEHALLILNGRCTGPAPEQQMQMQYELMRAFGRVLGLGWSQVNDNVFTGSPAPTYYQALNWPIMHPIDIICGPYTYQCLPQPFTLRPDDLSSLAALYFIGRSQALPGQTDTLLRAQEIFGRLTFPTGQGMQGVNVVARRWHQAWGVPEAWQTVSSVSGFLFKGANGNPVTGPLIVTPETSGSSAATYEGYYDLRRIPMLDGTWQNVQIDTEPINPLYTGSYAVGPYRVNQVEPSGSDTPLLATVQTSYYIAVRDLSTGSAAATCDTGLDGTEVSPASISADGWSTGTLCAYGHAAWFSLDVKAHRSFTLEVAAVDEQGFATTLKAMPLIGVWNAADATGTPPSVATATAFNGAVTGLTTVTLANAQSRQLRVVVADQRGDGRPDFAYRLRLLSADAVSPANVSAAGGVVTITGKGFRIGNVVTVDGVAATVSSWTATSIVATVPSSRMLGANTAFAADVAVTDLSTRGTTVMTAALNYAAPQPTLSLVAAPSGTVFAGDTAPAPFAVRLIAADGVTPLANRPVTFTATAGAAQFNACGAAACTLLTDASGSASTTVTALVPGSISLSAASAYGSQGASLTAVARIRAVTPVVAVQYIAAHATVPWEPQVALGDNSGPTAGVRVNWRTTSGAMTFSLAQSTADAQGMASATATAGPLNAGEQATASACAWTTVCASFAAEGVGSAGWRLEIVNGAGQSVAATGTLAPVTLRVIDIAGHFVAGVPVQIHQTVDAWQMPCPDRGRCPVPPNDDLQTSSALSDTNGLVTFAPLQAPDTAEVTDIVAVAGEYGFVSLSLQKQP
ncbi:MAG: hypothetical protein BGO25_00830 [Acidobacteriales bacterium 59-55]|nr:IPT/TIG domain-containing protein [Terriglobales bacterium]ODU54499.1 MAG: hypothetical protein ABT04_02780 [Granulicella sp. SCN 62-9]OJV39807.1 MAG: hypothetical protein BGO25_00830 [Acidobacteriales bacterium 59-55]